MIRSVKRGRERGVKQTQNLALHAREDGVLLDQMFFEDLEGSWPHWPVSNDLTLTFCFLSFNSLFFSLDKRRSRKEREREFKRERERSRERDQEREIKREREGKPVIIGV